MFFVSCTLFHTKEKMSDKSENENLRKRNKPRSTNPYWYFKPFELKKHTYRKFLEQSGILGHITRVLTDLYDTPEKPPYPVHYFRKHFLYMAPDTPNLEFLIELLNDKREELLRLRKENLELKRMLAVYDEEYHLKPLHFRPIRKIKPQGPYDFEFWSSSTERISASPDLQSKYKERDDQRNRIREAVDRIVESKIGGGDAEFGVMKNIQIMRRELKNLKKLMK